MNSAKFKSAMALLLWISIIPTILIVVGCGRRYEENARDNVNNKYVIEYENAIRENLNNIRTRTYSTPEELNSVWANSEHWKITIGDKVFYRTIKDKSVPEAEPRIFFIENCDFTSLQAVRCEGFRYSPISSDTVVIFEQVDSIPPEIDMSCDCITCREIK